MVEASLTDLVQTVCLDWSWLLAEVLSIPITVIEKIDEQKMLGLKFQADCGI